MQEGLPDSCLLMYPDKPTATFVGTAVSAADGVVVRAAEGAVDGVVVGTAVTAANDVVVGGISDSLLFNKAASGGRTDESLKAPSESKRLFCLRETASTLCPTHNAHARSIVSIACFLS